MIPVEALHPGTDPALAAELVALQRVAYAVEEPPLAPQEGAPGLRAACHFPERIKEVVAQ